MGELTERQREVLRYIDDYITAHDRAPSNVEIGEHFGFSSQGTVTAYLDKLEEYGCIERERYKSRSIRVKRPCYEHYPGSILSSPEGRALNRAKEALEDAATFEEAYETLLVAQLVAITRARGVAIHMVDWVRGALVPRVWHGCWKNHQAPQSFKYGKGVAGWVWANKKGWVSKGDVRTQRRYAPSSTVETSDIKSLLVVPFYDAEGEVIGTISLDSDLEDRFSKKMMETVEELVQEVTGAVQALRWLDEQIKEQTRTYIRRRRR